MFDLYLRGLFEQLVARSDPCTRAYDCAFWMEVASSCPPSGTVWDTGAEKMCRSGSGVDAIVPLKFQRLMSAPKRKEADRRPSSGQPEGSVSLKSCSVWIAAQLSRKQTSVPPYGTLS